MLLTITFFSFGLVLLVVHHHHELINKSAPLAFFPGLLSYLLFVSS